MLPKKDRHLSIRVDSDTFDRLRSLASNQNANSAAREIIERALLQSHAAQEPQHPSEMAREIERRLTHLLDSAAELRAALCREAMKPRAAASPMPCPTATWAEASWLLLTMGARAEVADESDFDPAPSIRASDPNLNSASSHARLAWECLMAAMEKRMAEKNGGAK